jgi:hypothetical protein
VPCHGSQPDMLLLEVVKYAAQPCEETALTRASAYQMRFIWSTWKRREELLGVNAQGQTKGIQDVRFRGIWKVLQRRNARIQQSQGKVRRPRTEKLRASNSLERSGQPVRFCGSATPPGDSCVTPNGRVANAVRQNWQSGEKDRFCCSQIVCC